MKIIILSEPRSGSTNFSTWFSDKTKFTIFHEPFNVDSFDFQKNKPLFEYGYETEHIVIREVYYLNKQSWEELIKFADKIIVLYREDYQKQLESFSNSIITNNWWFKEYVYENELNKIKQTDVDYFNTIKKEFKEKYLNKDFFKISYENLYYQNGIEKIKEYLDINELYDYKWPIGKKYRLEIDKEKRNIL